MDAIDRRSALRGILCVAVAAGFGASSFPNTVEAMPLALEKGLGNEADDLKVKVQAVTSRPSRTATGQGVRLSPAQGPETQCPSSGRNRAPWPRHRM